MSKPMISSNPAMALVRAAPTTPPAGPERIESLPWKRRASTRPPFDCMNKKACITEGAADAIDIAAEDGGKIGIDHGGIAAAHEFHQWADLVRRGDLGESDLATERGNRAFVVGEAVAMHEHNGGGAYTRGVGPHKSVACLRQIHRSQHGTVGHNALVDLDRILVEHFREDDMADEQVGSVLVPDSQCVPEAAGDDQQSPLARAFQERVGSDRGAHLDRTDTRRRELVRRPEIEDLADALQCRIVVAAGVLREDLAGLERAVRRACDDIGEGAAAVDPELPRLARIGHR